MAREIRLFGDPVLKAPAAEITNVDDKLVRLVREMFETMYEAPGIGLAAPQVGVQKQLFVYDNDGTAGTIINPTVKESSGEWVFDEGCLSIPGLYVEIVRPKNILVHGWDLDGNELEFEADELWARLIQHELDHLHGVLMFDRMTPEQRKEAMVEYRRIQQEPAAPRRPRRLRLS
ncbi:MAG: peptide deformylase [Actinomycetota bacterium]|jgi:peptide deformylase